MGNIRLKALTTAGVTSIAILAVVAVPDAHAQTDDRAASSAGLVRTASGEDMAGVAKHAPVNPREWPSIAASERFGRLSGAQSVSPSHGRTRVQRHGRAYRQAQRITAAVALGILGSFVGGAAGAGIAGLTREEAVLPGFAVGMCVGGVGGATLGALLVK